MLRPSPLPRLLLAPSLLALAACAPEAESPVFISLPAADAVARVDPATGEVLSQTQVGMLPHLLQASADGASVYVVLTGSQAVAELDAASGEVKRTFLTAPVPAVREDGSPLPEHTRDGAAAHTTCFACHGRGGRARPAVVGTRPFGMALSADGTRLFVANSKGGTLARIRLSDGALEALVPVAATGEAHEPTSLARLGGSLFLSVLPTLPPKDPGVRAVVRRLSADGERVLTELPTGANAGELRADEVRGELYVSNFETNTLTRLTAQGEAHGVSTVGNGPLGTLPTGDGALLVANYYDNSLSRVPLEGGDVLTVKLTRGDSTYVNPTHLTLRDGTLYVLSSGTAGHLLTVDPRTLAVTRAVKVGGLPFDLLAPSPK